MTVNFRFEGVTRGSRVALCCRIPCRGCTWEPCTYSLTRHVWESRVWQGSLITFHRYWTATITSWWWQLDLPAYQSFGCLVINTDRFTWRFLMVIFLLTVHRIMDAFFLSVFPIIPFRFFYLYCSGDINNKLFFIASHGEL